MIARHLIAALQSRTVRLGSESVKTALRSRVTRVMCEHLRDMVDCAQFRPTLELNFYGSDVVRRGSGKPQDAGSRAYPATLPNDIWAKS